ncbi:Pseudouridine synthase I, TruA [Penicillium expansum]|uniref:tRNA pseudouridine synthase 1 n=1 Tax=Penicillium expansum TaxID=27334 RepID=A0A0A2KE25_PENEN|nr:Pseudouridine synthase I, TruA [Penicillium expansum]KGO62610.1 Pseudouridine synthase I, TruA [Penicillium expansum]
MEKMNRAEWKGKFPRNIDFMRASIIHQRNLFGILSASRSSILIRSLPQTTQNHTVSRQFYRSFWRDPSAPHTDLSEVFQRIQWPTTKEQEVEVVKGVRTAIWGERNGAIDKRQRHEDKTEAKRRKIENGEELNLPIYATQFSNEEIDSEERRPKKKVALLMGYSGTGYYGMQLNEQQRTIEGDLFTALVNVGAVSKANAADPKKSSFVRCARTDKGVHAAGNVVSLKMIVEDEDIIQKINAELSPQIRVWGYEVTSKSFSCYQMCDSRIYEYLMPSHCLLPAHPSTYLGKKIVEFADKAGELDAVRARQEEVAGYWEDVDEKYIKPILEALPENVRTIVEKSLYEDESRDALQPSEEKEVVTSVPADEPAQQETGEQPVTEQPADAEAPKPFVMDPRQKAIINAIKSIKAAYLTAKRTYRAPASRIARLQECLDRYEGTKNFHNYTVQKTYKDPSAKRHIKSFKVNTTPIIIDGTEWLSLKVHGQSFMMHQIRKMVAMATMVVRSGCPPDRINETYGPERIAIPKAPGLGLLLERPIFDAYNTKTQGLDRQPLNFQKFEAEMNEFKQREIYDRIFREEEQSAGFGSFFNHIDHFPAGYFLYVTSGGIPAAKLATAPTAADPSSPKAGKRTRGAPRAQQDALAAVEVESDEGEAPAGGEAEG